MGEILEEIPPHHKIAETAQGSLLARTQPQQTGKGNQLLVGGQPQRGDSSATRLQRLISQHLHTPLMAAQE